MLSMPCCLVQVVWKGDEVWLETDLKGFSRKGLAEIRDRFRSRIRLISCRGSSVAKAVRLSGIDSSSGTVSSASSPPQLASRLSLEPLGSERFPAGSIEVINATEVYYRFKVLLDSPST